MNTSDRVDPELVTPLQGFLDAIGGGINLHDIPATRAAFRAMDVAAKAQLPPFEGVTIEDRHVPGPKDSPDVMVRIYQPTQRPVKLPCLLWIHGGGYVLGSVE